MAGLGDHLVVWVAFDDRGEIMQALPITGPSHRVTKDEGTRSALVAVRIDDLVGAGGMPLSGDELEVSRALDQKGEGECGSCSFRSVVPPQLLMPGEACPFPSFAEVRGDVDSRLAASIRAGLRLGHPGACSPRIDLSRSSPEFEVEFISPAEDAEPFRIGVRTAAGDVVLASERSLLFISPDDTRRPQTPPFSGPVVALEALGQSAALAVSLSLDTLAVDLHQLDASGTKSLGSIPGGLRFSGSLRGVRAARMADGSVWVFVAQSQANFAIDEMLVVSCRADAPCDSPERVLIRSDAELGGPALGFVDSAIVPVQRAAPIVIERRLGGFDHTRPSWVDGLDVGLMSPMAHLGSEAVACGLRPDGQYELTRSTEGGRGPWSTLLRSVHACAILEGFGEVVAVFEDGQAAIVTEAGVATTRSSELGIDLRFVLPRTAGSPFLATTKSGQWIESDGKSLRRVLYGTERELDFPEAVASVGGKPIISVLPGVFRELGPTPRTHRMTGFPGRVAAMTPDSSGTLWVVGSTLAKGFAARVSLESSTFERIELPDVPGLVAVAAIAEGRALAVGEDWTILELSSTKGELVEFSWDDSAVEGIETAPAPFPCLVNRPPLRPHTWVSADARGDGVAWLSGCGGVLARAVVHGEHGLVVTRVALPDELIRLHDSRLAELTVVRSFGVSGAITASPPQGENPVGLLRIWTSVDSIRPDGLAFERLERLEPLPGGLNVGDPLGLFVDEGGHLTAVSAQYPEEVVIDRPFAPAQRRVDMRATGAVSGEGSRLWVASTHGRLAEAR